MISCDCGKGAIFFASLTGHVYNNHLFEDHYCRCLMFFGQEQRSIYTPIQNVRFTHSCV